MKKLKSRKTLIIVCVVALLISFLIYSRIASADLANKIAVKNAYLTGIETGGGSFDSSDGLNYSDETGYSAGTGYTAGNDSSASNRIVRSFDTLTYDFTFELTGKDGDSQSYSMRTLNIDVTLSEEEAKYVTFDKTSAPGETKHTFTVDNVSVCCGSETATVTLYVLGAPNGFEIKPKFEMYESTDKDATHVTLGLNSDGKYNYSYDSEARVKYSNTSNTLGFRNYLPTIVSSKQGEYKVVILSQSSEGQKATYKNAVGRYITFVYGLELVGTTANNKGIKGLTMPDGSNITIPLSISQNGKTTNTTVETTWNRLYGTETISSIEPVVTSLPYSSGVIDTVKKVRYPGSTSISGSGQSYNVTLSDYKMSFSPVNVCADGSTKPNSEYVIGSYALTVFSERTSEDEKNPIQISMSVANGVSIKDTAGNSISVSGGTVSATNNYYENIDYSLTGEFYDTGDNKLSNSSAFPDSNGTGSLSKGTSFVYKTTFNYKKTLSDQGLKEVIKVDANAFRVIPVGDEDIKITVESDGNKLSADDFEVKYVSGSYDNKNYSASSYDDTTINSRLSSEDVATVKTACTTVKNNLSTYSVNQIQNLYGGPCITANEGVETEYKTIKSAKTEGDNSVEVPITKVIVQTKEGVILPDDVKVTIEVGLRVRNVSDLTQTYQATVVASSSDYDKVLTYYSPRITTDNNSITNPDNYTKTVYKGSTISYVDSRLWGDSLKIVNFTSRQTITVTNKDENGNVKTRYNSNSGETLTYNIKTVINDNNELVGADDVWYINNLEVTVNIPSTLEYVPDSKLGTPTVSNNNDGTTTLTYKLPYTKPNQKIKDINFKANISPKISGSGVEVTVTSNVNAININGERDNSYIGYLSSSFSIYVTGVANVIVSQKVGKEGSVIEKNGEFSYLLGAYNNTGYNVTDYGIMDILPSSSDGRGTSFSGKYSVKVTLPDSILNTAKVYCTTVDTASLTNSVLNEKNGFTECNVLDEYVEATAIKITNISIPKDSYMSDITVSIKTSGNTYSDKYVNSFIGESETFSKNESNKLTTRVVSRNISGRAFVDLNENGIEDDGDTYFANMPVTLYRLDDDGNLKEVANTSTDKNGEYKFKDLDSGRYKVRATYDSELYDLTLRYATEDVEHDSDAYKIQDGEVEISNKRTPTEVDGIIVGKCSDGMVESVSDMNIGLINRKTFGFDISKYITKVELSYNNSLTTYNYDNQNKVSISVKNSLRATARIYYGIKIENNSTKSGYVKLINEDVPSGLNFNLSDTLNKDWFYSDGSLRSISLADDLIKPGESRYLTVVLDMPTQSEAKTFLNTVTLLDIEEYNPEPLAEDTNAESNEYTFGEAVTYAGVNWHVISASEKDSEGAQTLTLLADDQEVKGVKMHAVKNKNLQYKWSLSDINTYLNESFANENSLNLAILYDNQICDDSSGLSISVNKDKSGNAIGAGGTLYGQAICQSNIYTASKVRLLTEVEYNSIVDSLTTATDKSWLGSSFWLMNSVFIQPTYDVYGKETNTAINMARSVNSSGVVSNTSTSTLLNVRPVITVSSKNVIAE